MPSHAEPAPIATDGGPSTQGGDFAALIRAFAWSRTPLGPEVEWPARMRGLLDAVLLSSAPMLTLWGREGIMIYNRACAAMAGGRHSAMLGAPASEAWPELFESHRRVLGTGRPERTLISEKGPSGRGGHDRPDRRGLAFHCSPIPDESGLILGSLCVLERPGSAPAGEPDDSNLPWSRQALLLALADRFRNSADPAEILAAACETVGREIGATRVAFGDVAPPYEEATLETGWSDGSIEAATGTVPTGALFAGRIGELKAGRTVVFDAARGSPGEALGRPEDQGLESKTGIIAPLIRDGHFRAFLLVEGTTARSWAPEEISLVEDVTSRTWDAVERARAVAVLRRNQARQAFLLVLGDRLRELDDPDEIMETVAESLGQHLRLSRAGYGEVLSGEQIMFATGWSDGSVPPLIGEFPLDSLGPRNAADLSKGLTATFEGGGAGEPKRPADSVMHGLASAVAVPLIRDGTLRGALILGQCMERRWSSDEVALAGEVAARLWEALERARAEAALHDINATLENRVAQRTFELTSSEARFRTLFENAPAPIFLIRVGPGREAVYDAANAAAERFTGRPAQEIVGRAVTQRTSDGEPLLESCIRCVLTGQPVNYEINIEAGGASRTAECVLAPLPIEAEDGTRLLIGIARDITGQRLAEEQLRQAQKMEAIGQLTGGIAHDFNNLLTGIIGSLALMEKRLAQGRTDAIQRYAGLALASANRAAALTHRLLAFSRRQPLEAKPVDVNGLVTSMDDLLRRTLGESIALETIQAADVWLTLCDPHQLENALLNLAINARDAMPDGGRLTIETANAILDEVDASREPGIRQGEYVVVSVADTGTGMQPDVAARAFDPFFTTKPIGQGTGLGLSMIYGFAKQSEGHVRIESEVGQGTTVKIFLPRHRGHEMPAPGETSRLDLRADSGETILVVEDDPTVRGLALEVLRDLGYTVIEAADGPAGLRSLQADRRIDLLITDVGLPGINGRQLAEQGRSRRPDLKVLFITGYAENASFGTGHFEAGVQMMPKPFTVEEFAARIRSILMSSQTPAFE